MKQPCTVIRLALDSIDRSVSDPKLTALIHDGWTVEESLALSEEDGPPSWILLLAPPRVEAEKPGTDRAILALVLTISLLSGLFLGIGVSYLLSQA